MFKKIVSGVLLAAAALASVGASAQTIKGVNQNGMQESIPHEAIARYKHNPATGVLQYEHRYNGTIYQITDPSANEAAELYVHFGSFRAVTPDGWTIHRGRIGVLCQTGGGQPYTMLKVYGHNGTISFVGDNCAFANQMYQQ